MFFMFELAIYESGVTGPSYTIGGSSSYHIDSKFSTSLGEENARLLFEAKVRKYAELGRDVEFSNRGVAGIVYNLDAHVDTRRYIFRRAHMAHAHRPGWYSLDYYAPFHGMGRYHWSAQKAPIFAVTYAGGHRKSGYAWNYGFYTATYDQRGRLIAKVGHGDNRYPTHKPAVLVAMDGGPVIQPAEPDVPVVIAAPKPELSPIQIAIKYEQILAQQY